MPTPKVVILGAGRPYRASQPSALAFASGDQRVLDWVMAAFSSLQSPEFHFVAGYRLDEIIHRYPHLHFSINDEWESSGSAGSLLVAPIGVESTVYVCYADIVFARSVVEDLHREQGDLVVAIDRRWKQRYPDRDREDLLIAEKVALDAGDVRDIGRHVPVAEAGAEFAGVLKLCPRALNAVHALHREEGEAIRRADLPALLMRLKRAGMRIRAVDVAGSWAELNQPEDLAHFVLGTKAETLENLRPLVRKSVIGDVLRFTVGQWLASRRQLVADIQDRFGRARLAVRSSTTAEDGWVSSCAGRFRSVLDVDGASEQAIVQAVEDVVRSYGDDRPGHQVLVQAMLSDVALSGVVTTRTLNHGGPYYTISFDAGTSSTSTVTSGAARALRTVTICRYAESLPATAPPALGRVLEAARELEQLVGYDALDIEFGETADGVVHVLQCRPIAVRHGYRWVSDGEVSRALDAASAQFNSKAQAPPHLLGERTVYGVMPDWNPAEMIGPKPRQLALSLYRYLVTDEIWAAQRAEYGYRDVRPQPLLTTFAGHPYIDLRACFNSFVPATLGEDLARRLVEHYLERLRACPQLHDKIEFEVAFTCYTFDFDEQARGRLAPNGFSQDDTRDLRRALLEITARGVRRCGSDLAAIDVLAERYARTVNSGLPPLERAAILLDDCKRLGTLPFAHLARGGFVAVALLRSLETTGALKTSQREAFLGSLRTVVREFERDGRRVASGELPWETFVERYGHLRPGTYEITSSSYGQDPERYLRHMVEPKEARKSAAGTPCWPGPTRDRIAASLRQAELDVSVEDLEAFLRTAIEGREYAKFIFSRNVSAALEAFAEFGRAWGLTRPELSHLSVWDLLRFRFETPLGDGPADLKRLAEHEMELHRTSQVIELPPLILGDDDFRAFEAPPSQPNFVTRHHVTAPAVEVREATDDLAGRIVLIPQADPGFDWLFGHAIAGLITMYGGANSHMTIRSAELDLPAAIGVGRRLYQDLAEASLIDLDCGARQIRVVS